MGEEGIEDEMYIPMSDISKISQVKERKNRDWEDVRRDLTPTDTDTVLQHLNIMSTATFMYEGDQEELRHGIRTRYKELIDEIEEEGDVEQYQDLGAFSIGVAVEVGNEPALLMYAEEDFYSQTPYPGILVTVT